MRIRDVAFKFRETVGRYDSKARAITRRQTRSRISLDMQFMCTLTRFNTISIYIG